MSYPEKRTITSMVTGVLILAAYFIYTFGVVQADLAATDLKFWAITMLVFIGIGIVATIIIQIIFHILLSIGIAIKNGQNDDAKINKTIEAMMVEDEMDKLIELKSLRIGFAFAGFGLIAGLITLALGYSPALMLNILFAAFSVGSLLEGFTSLHYYRKGVHHG